jgi:predicted dinucleotide-binding enzyme
VANAFAPGFTLLYPNSSVGEKLHEALPAARVVKTMNTARITMFTDPTQLGPATVFLSGNDPAAKSDAANLLRDFGWSNDAIIDLGGIESARGPEHYFVLFGALAGALGSMQFNIRVIGAEEERSTALRRAG